ncbi:MAG TPA: hypothetical protein VFW24_13755 [Acidimicrobiales bacterium]|nr:hypothetical protein [Acidimicrobiales bacterium]
MPGPERLLVLDASLNRRIAAELKGRGRAATAAAELGMARAGDSELLRGVTRRMGSQPWVLVTADDFLPAEHAELVADLGVTVATVQAQGRGRGVDEERFARETCHRWAHSMAHQAAGVVRRYSPAASRPWTARLR